MPHSVWNDAHVCIRGSGRRDINITIKDIARLAGVSHSTVSRGLNGSSKVKPETRNRIRAIAKQHNFEFNAGARSLSTKRTGTVGIIHPELYNDFSASLFCGSLLSEIRRRLDEAGIDFIPIFSENRENSSSNIRRLARQQKVDAFILVDSMVSAEDWEFLHKYRVPSIQLHYRPKYCSTDSMHYIFSDNFSGGKLATDFLIEQGCEHLMCITIKSDHLEIRDRIEGFKYSLAEHGLPVDRKLIIEDDCSFFYGENIIRENRELLNRVDGIFVHADIMALGIVNELKAQGYKVPDDIRVVGYDDIELGTYFNPSLTTVHQPKEALAEKACNKLIEILNNEGAEENLLQEVIKPSLIIRESC